MYTLKKSLGQHFLKDENICRKIIEHLPAEPGTNLLEIGPGGGALTKYLLQLPGVHFKAIEIDEEKVNYLLHTFPDIKGKIVHDNILTCRQPFDGPFTVVGNFPYNISSQILFRILEWKSQVSRLVGMFQKEVALRIAASSNSKEYGILSVLIQSWYDVEYLFEVSEQCFVPPPKVRSAVIRLTKKALPPAVKSDRDLVRLVKAAFGQRRKKLRNPLKGMFDKAMLQEDIFDKRAEQLTVSEFISLTHSLQ